jgi:integrase
VANILKKRGLLVSFVFPDELGVEPFAEFLVRFWTYDKSPYVKDKHAHGYRMGRTHCEQSLGRAQKYWVPFFVKKRLSEITKADLKTFALYLGDDKLGLSPVTRNRVLTVGTTALRWAYANEYIREDVTAGVATFSEKLRKRGVLSPSEVKKLFALEWPDDRIKLGNLVAATTGLRVSEVIALKPENVSAKSLYVENSFSEIDGLKCTKTDEVRRVPLLPEISEALLKLAKRNPYNLSGYIFWGDSAERPMNQRLMLYGLQRMLVILSVGCDASKEAQNQARAYWKKRNVVFHSWRHFYAARMADKLDSRKVMLATGHTTEAVFNSYANHAQEQDFLEVASVTEEVFYNIFADEFPVSEIAKFVIEIKD